MWSTQHFVKMVSTRKMKNQQKRQLSHLDETLNDSAIGNSVNVNVSERETLEQEANCQPNDFRRLDNSERQNQVIDNHIDDQITRAVSSAVMIVENCTQDAILTAIDKVVIARVEMVVKSITGSTGHRINSEVQNPDRKNFVWNIRNFPIMLASSWLDLDNELNRNDETRNKEDFEDGDFPAFRPKYERRAHAHHSINLFCPEQINAFNFFHSL